MANGSGPNATELLRGVSVVCAVGEGWACGCSDSDGTLCLGPCGHGAVESRPPLAYPSRDLVSSLRRCYSPGARDREPRLER